MVALTITLKMRSCRKFADVFYAPSFIFMAIFLIFFLNFSQIRPNLCQETFSENRNRNIFSHYTFEGGNGCLVLALNLCVGLTIKFEFC